MDERVVQFRVGVTVLATVVEVDGQAGSFTVRGPAGNVRTLQAETPEHREAGKLKMVRQGRHILRPGSQAAARLGS